LIHKILALSPNKFKIADALD